jgi:glycosyltransferase involved in cell wall biosynthesis
MAARVSVVVPVYRVEEYLPRCLQSLEEQTIFPDLEILLIDDGSPDRSGELCDRFAEKHENVRVIHKENGGVSSARNAGLAAATGDYLAFLDSDDFVRKDAYSTAYEAAVGSGADIVVFRLACVPDDREAQKPPAPGEPRTITGGEAILRSLINHKNGVYESGCDKLFRRELLEGLSFPAGIRCGEDAVLLAGACARAERALVINDILYFYRMRPGSAMRTVTGAIPDERVAAHEEIARIAAENFPSLRDDAAARAHYMRLLVINEMMDCPDYRSLPAWKRQVKALRKSLPKVLLARSKRWMPPSRKVYAALLAAFPRLAARLHQGRALRRKDAQCHQASA